MLVIFAIKLPAYFYLFVAVVAVVVAVKGCQ